MSGTTGGRNRAAGLALFLLLGAILAGGTTAQTGGDELGHASITVLGDPDVAAVLTPPGQGSSLCYRDLESGGGYTAGDPVYLVIDRPDCATEPGRVGIDWIRITSSQDGEAGSRVGVTDPDRSAPVSRLFDLESFDVDLLWYYDANDNGASDAGDTAYLSQSARVDAGDVRLTAGAGHPAGSAVGNDADLNRDLAPWSLPRIQQAVHYLEVDQEDGFSGADVPYLLGHLDAPGGPIVPRVNDVRLGPFGEEHGFGQRIAGGDGDVVSVLRAGFAVTGAEHDGSLCALSTDGSGTYRPGDPVYFVPGSTNCRNGGSVQVHDLRLSGEQAGSKVRQGDDDHGHASFVQLDGGGAAGSAFLSYHDRIPFGSFTADDTLYLITQAGRDHVRIGDLRLTPHGAQEAGTSVQADDDDLNLPVTSFAAGGSLDHIELFAHHDLNNNRAFDWDDVLYIRDDPQEERVLHNFVRLSATGSGFGYGSITAAGGPGVTVQLHRLHETGSAGDRVCGVEENANGVYDPGEPVILRREGSCNDRSSFSDLRLTTSEHGAAGTLVRSGDGDWNRILSPFGSDVCLDHSAGHASLLEADAVLYLTRCSDTVQAGDLRLTEQVAHPGGSAVQSGDADHNETLADGATAAQSERRWNLDNAFYYHDTNNVGRLSTGGLVYLALHNPPDEPAPATTMVQVHDVRLSPAGHLLPPEQVPSAPREVSAAAGDSRVVVDWSPPDGPAPVEGYRVEWGVDSGEYDESTLAEEPPVTIEGLTNDVEYFFVVRATNELGAGPASEQVRATPRGDASGGVPSAPTNLVVEVLGSTQVEVSWREPEAGAGILEYRVRAGSASGGPYSLNWSAPEPRLTADGLEPGAQYFFVVVAVNDLGESPPSQEATVTLGEQEETPALSFLGILLVGLAVVGSRLIRTRL